MNKLASFFAALIIVTTFTGCSDEKEKESIIVKNDNTSNTIQKSELPKPTHDEKASIKKNFINSCISGSGITEDALIPQITEVCGCTYNSIIEEQGIAEFIRIDKDIRDGKSKTVPEKWNIDSVVSQCVKKLDS